MQDLIAFWHQHWDTIVHYLGVVVPWWVEIKLRTLGVLLSWPAVTLYLGLLFMIMFRGPLREFIGRVTEGELPGGIKFRAAETQASVKSADPKSIEKAAIEAEAEREKKPAAQIVKPEGIAPPDVPAPNVVAQPPLEQQLRGALEITAKWLSFERTLNVIFGSQLSFLFALRARPPEGMGFLELYSYYGVHQRSMKPAPATWDAWLGWLIAMQMVAASKTDPHHWILQPLGREFLQYIDENYRLGPPFRAG